MLLLLLYYTVAEEVSVKKLQIVSEAIYWMHSHCNVSSLVSIATVPRCDNTLTNLVLGLL